MAFQIRGRAGNIPFLEPGDTASAIGQRIVGVDTNRCIEMCKGRVESVLIDVVDACCCVGSRFRESETDDRCIHRFRGDFVRVATLHVEVNGQTGQDGERQGHCCDQPEPELPAGVQRAHDVVNNHQPTEEDKQRRQPQKTVRHPLHPLECRARQ